MRSVRDTFLAFAFLALGLAIAAVTWDIVTRHTFGQPIIVKGFGPESGQDSDRLDSESGKHSRNVWIKFVLVSLDATDCGPIALANGRRLTLLDDKAPLTRAEALELYALLESLESFEVVGSASAVTGGDREILVQFVDEVPYVEKVSDDDATTEQRSEQEVGVRMYAWRVVSGDGAGIILKGIRPEVLFAAGWSATPDNPFGKPHSTGWSTSLELTLPNGGCYVMTGLDPQVPSTGPDGVQRFAGRKGVLFISATALPAVGTRQPGLIHEQLGEGETR